MSRWTRDGLAAIVHELRYRPWRDRRGGRVVELSADPLVSVVCVSNRPRQLDHVLASFEAQRQVHCELVLVTNADGYGPVAADRTETLARVTVVETDPSVTLGAALNRGVHAAQGEVIAKFDDDDWYAPDYLANGLADMHARGAGVVGKKTYYVYFEQGDQTVRLFDGNENQRVGRLAGGTLLFHRDVWEQNGFDDVNLGEDGRFVRAAERSGFVVFSGSAAGFLQTRGDDNTWAFDDESLAADGVVIGPGSNPTYWH